MGCLVKRICRQGDLRKRDLLIYFLFAYVLQLRTVFQSITPRLRSSSSEGVGEGERSPGRPDAYPPGAYDDFAL